MNIHEIRVCAIPGEDHGIVALLTTAGIHSPDDVPWLLIPTNPPNGSVEQWADDNTVRDWMVVWP